MTSLERRAYRHGAEFIAEIQITRALLKFCRDHGYLGNSSTIHDLEACLAALEAGELTNAIAAFKRIPMDKEGFGDWWPPAVFPGETEEYVGTVFNALMERWHRLLSLRAKKG